MSHTTPGEHGPQVQQSSPDLIGQGPPEPQPRGSGRGTKIVIGTVALALVAGGGAFAFYAADPLGVFRSGPQAAAAIPADALFYVGVDLAPAAEQKINALLFLNHFPAFQDETNLDDENVDVREQVLDDAFEAVGCELSYAADIKPWLGSKFALAGVAASGSAGSSDLMGAIEVTDEAKAKEGLASIAACASDVGSTDFGYSFTGDYALVAETQELADQFAADADDSSLADDEDFTADMESLGDVGIATMWADIEGSVDAFGIADEAGPAGAELDMLTTSYQRAAATLRFEPDRVQLVSSVFGDIADIDHGDNEIVELPDSTVFAMSEAGGENRLNASWDALLDSSQAGGVDVAQEIDDFEAQTGFTLPDDLGTILGDNIMLAVDAENLTADALEAKDPSAISAGVRFSGDPDKLNDLYDRILALAEGGFAMSPGQELPFSKVDSDDGIVMATNDSYAETLAGLGGSLGDSAQFQSVVDDAAGQEFVLYFDWDAIEEEALEAARNAGESQDVLDNVTPLRAFGVTTETEGDYTLSVLQLSVND